MAGKKRRGKRGAAGAVVSEPKVSGGRSRRMASVFAWVCLVGLVGVILMVLESVKGLLLGSAAL